MSNWSQGAIELKTGPPMSTPVVPSSNAHSSQPTSAANHEQRWQSHLQADFSSWVKATCPPQELVLGLPGFKYEDLYHHPKLEELTETFYSFFKTQDPQGFELFTQYRQAKGELGSPQKNSEALLAAAPHVSAFILKLFRVENEAQALKDSVLSADPLWVFKKDFVRKKVWKSDSPISWDKTQAALVSKTVLTALGVDSSCLNTGSEDEELAVAKAVLGITKLDDTARMVAKAGGAQWTEELTARGNVLLTALSSAHEIATISAINEAINTAPAAEYTRPGAIAAVVLSALGSWLNQRLNDHHDQAHLWQSLREPKKLDFQNLVQLKRPNEKLPELFIGDEHHRRARDGFVLTDRRGDTRLVQSEVDYCLYCHDRDKDSCSKGLRDNKTNAIKPNPLGVPLNGCPLDEKISEAHMMRKQGDTLAALALITVDNPMCPGTGHRICNDCMKACVFQKQEPVNIPQIETRILSDILNLPWGMEIYGLLTRWNPLNVKWPQLAPLNGKAALVVGLGPAGYTLSHHLSRAGFAVVGIDGLKIEALPVEITGDEDHPPRPIKDFSKLAQELDERILLGFGGVSEYGITPRWDKNFLSVLYITVSRNRRVRIYGGIRFGGTVSLDDAWRYGFDHVALAAGAGKPTLIEMKNNLARGIRKASDFLMALQLSGAYKYSSLANLQIQLPAVVIGGGLTAIDTATELLAYYVVQCEKTAARYGRLVQEKGEEAFSKLFDAEETAFIKEQLEHAALIKKERELAAQEGRDPQFQPLLDSWGGVSLVYRKTVLDSPAYRLNHEEVEKSLEEGVRYIECMAPVEAVVGETGAVKAMGFERQVQKDGKWVASGEMIELPARTVCVAAGTSPNITYERENPQVFALDSRKQFFQTHEIKRDENGAFVATPSKDTKNAFFTNYVKGEKTVSFYGDNHPYYAGSVVKAMASAKYGFEKVADLYNHNPAGDEAERQRRKAKMFDLFDTLDREFVATVHDVIRLTPTIVEVIVHAPAAARKFEPGQFYRLQNFEGTASVVNGVRLATEGMALTGAWVDKEKGLMSTIVLEMGSSTRMCALLKKGERVILMGPTGSPTEIPEKENVLLAGGGLGNAVLFSVAKALQAKGSRVIYFAGYRKGEDLYHREDIETHCDQVIWCTDTGKMIEPSRPQDKHYRGNIVQAMVAYARGELGEKTIELNTVSRLIAIGSDRMMNAVREARHGILAPYLNKRHIGIASINSPMQCMMKEICAQCLQKHRDPETGKEYVVFSCTNQDQELDRVDFAHLNQRLRSNSAQEKISNEYLSLLLAGLS